MTREQRRDNVAQTYVVVTCNNNKYCQLHSVAQNYNGNLHAACVARWRLWSTSTSSSSLA
jgi:hypothetical protein